MEVGLCRTAPLSTYTTTINECLGAVDLKARHCQPSLQSISVASDGSEAFGTGGAGAVVYDPRARRLYCGAVKVTSGPGTLSSYRTELFGLLTALVMLWALRHRLPRLRVTAVLDNLGAVLAYKQLKARLPTTSQDIWDEIVWFAERVRRHYGLDVDWQRGHPERRKEPTKFSFMEALQHLSDGLAADGRRGRGAPDPSSSFSHGRRWFVRIDGRRVFDKTGEILLHEIGMKKLTSYRNYTPPTSAMDAWVRQAFCGKSKDVFSRAMTAKFILEQLATSERAAQWSYPVESTRCRLCCVDGIHENLRHLLLDCQCAKLCDIRRNYVRSIVAERYLDDGLVADFIEDNFRLCNGRLRCLFGHGGVDDDVASDAAYGFVRGFWSTDFIAAVRDLAPSDQDSVLWFSCIVRSFARAARNQLWRPVWDVWHSVAVQPSLASSSTLG